MEGSAARLEVVNGKAAGMSILISDELVIGRQAEGAGRLADDEEISRSHARLSMDSAGMCAIEDLGSTNGTFVNGMRITAPQTLSEGDTIEVGGTTMVVREIPGLRQPPPAEPAPAPPQRTVTQTAPVGDAGAAAPAGEAAAAAPATEPMASEPPEAEPVGPEPPAPEALAPAPEAPEAPAPEPSPPPAVTPPGLSLQLDIDFATHELKIRLDDSSEPIRLLFDGDSWRSASPSTEKGNPE